MQSLTMNLALYFRINLRNRRKELHLTQTQLADKMGIKQPNVAAIEAGERIPTLETCERFAAALETNAMAMLTEPVKTLV